MSKQTKTHVIHVGAVLVWLIGGHIWPTAGWVVTATVFAAQAILGACPILFITDKLWGVYCYYPPMAWWTVPFRLYWAAIPWLDFMGR